MSDSAEKQAAQNYLDELVSSYRHTSVCTCFGVPVEELTRDELIALIGFIGCEMTRLRSENLKNIQFFSEINRAKSR